MDIMVKNSECKFKYRVSGVIIVNEKILVDRYGEDTYCLPGGYVNMGETSEEAMKRELYEEIGYSFKIDSFMGITENFFTNRRSEKTHAIEFYYKASFENVDDIDNLEYNRIEDDYGVIINHHFEWIDIGRLLEVKLLPEVIKEVIIDGKEKFHYIIKE